MIHASPPDIVRYLAEFGLTLLELEPGQVAMFVAARNAARYIEPLEVPAGSEVREDGDATLTERETDDALDLVTRDGDPLASDLPADEMDVKQLRSVEDLPRIFPIQWLLEDVRPDLFYAKLARRELFMPEWQRLGQGPRESETETPRPELTGEASLARSKRQHAYVLLDTSSTMRDHDRRGTVARGVALAFLYRGFEQGARLHLRPFTSEVAELTSGLMPDEFRAMACRLVALTNAGQTRIQTALEQAACDVRGEGPCLGADIALITDGISRLSKSPLANERLHTYILGDLFDDPGVSGTVNTLKAWSYRFHRIWINDFAEILAPTWRDCQAAGLFLQAVLEHQENLTEAEREGLGRLLENVKYLLKEHQRGLGKAAELPAEARALQHQIEEAAQSLPPSSGPSPMRSGSSAPAAGQSSGTGEHRSGGRWTAVREKLDLWRLLAEMTKRLGRWASEVIAWIKRNAQRKRSG